MSVPTLLGSFNFLKSQFQARAKDPASNDLVKLVDLTVRLLEKIEKLEQRVAALENKP